MPSPAAPRPRLPVPLSRVATAPLAMAEMPGAEFLSQLIAERDRLPPQRSRRRATLPVAMSSYDAAAAQIVRRMPPGYRKTLLA